MMDRKRIRVLGRRDVLLGAGAAALVAAFLRAVPAAGASAKSAQFKAALNALLGDAKPVSGGIEMDLPDAVENGDYVPLSIAVESPMTEESHVKAIHLLSTANPRADVATYRFTPLSGKARVISRMRLAMTQEVIAIAELSDGTFLMSRRNVDVKIGGCGI
ncbi:MAG: thiosulfate oxidation carrier protein SoxY [Hyphomicrobium sp.]